MGVEARVVLFAPDEPSARAAAERAFRRIHALDATLSDWHAESELSRLVARAGTGPVELSDDLSRALERALSFAELSGGAFDPTVGALTRLWRERARAGAELDLAAWRAEWEAARERTGWERVRLDPRCRRAELVQGTALDLGAIGKGFACDEAWKELAAAGCPRSLVELGGDLALGEPPPGAQGWSVRVGGNSEAPPRQLVLARCGVATSGDREQHLELGGARWSHLIDPRTREPLADSLGMSVVACDATSADALASAASVLGRHQGRALVEAFGARSGGARLLVDDPRFTPLFDGATLAGWTTRGGRYDGDARWSVEAGELVGRPGPEGQGGLLYTERSYTAFELECEVRASWPFDSGVFARMRPPESGQRGVQLTLDAREGGEVGALYADEFLAHQPEGMRLWKREAWNHLFVRVTGFQPRVEAWLNGSPLADWDCSPHGEEPVGAPFAFAGLLGLQVHDVSAGADEGSAVRFRDLRLRELPVFGDAPFARRPLDFAGAARGSAEPSASAEGTAESRAAEHVSCPERVRGGWLPLLRLDGPDPLLDFEVHGPREGYAVEDGMLLMPSSGEAGELATRRDYGDFELRLDFRLAEMANSGVFLRAARDGSNPAYSGCEIQILDDVHWEQRTGTQLRPWQLTGSLYGAVAPAERAVRPIGEWNSFEIRYHGARLAVALNGRLLYDVDTLALAVEPPFAARAARGFLGLQRYALPERTAAHALAFRELHVREIKP